jgi:squalene-hopene/tetraprenyl-beta-curcumene cyclase
VILKSEVATEQNVPEETKGVDGATIDQAALDRAFDRARQALLAERTEEGHWVGELSTSALSTATAVCALALVDRARYADLIEGGLRWLSSHQNPDGGWGDTVVSVSNISTTVLAQSAFHLGGGGERYADNLGKALEYLARFGTTPRQIAKAVRLRYGRDRTFAVPILMTAALAGLVEWNEVAGLPFELACLPQRWYRLVRLPVVSYALPALIAVGQAVYKHRPPYNPVTRLMRALSIEPSLRVLEAIQPTSGGFLEAVPLTSFVTMSLAATGRHEHPVAKRGTEFLVKAVRDDGSWPIDSNLSTWVTTLSVNALSSAGALGELEDREVVRGWLGEQQFREQHPYTGAEPGGWAWTPLPGGVPDVDDTAGALLALANLPEGPITQRSAADGLTWLLALQNRDGGWPTFCRGWGYLAFDRSGPDLTAHAVRAVHAWFERWYGRMDRRTRRWIEQRALPRAMRYLARSQRRDGWWSPLWFGNQHEPNEENPVYGTCRVLAAYRDLDMMNSIPARKAIAWLQSVQKPDGGWGGGANSPSTIEETALAVEILCEANEGQTALNSGLAWLVERVDSGGLERPSPIGFYFAKLWYFERLYPMILATAALGRARRRRQQGRSAARCQ